MNEHNRLRLGKEDRLTRNSQTQETTNVRQVVVLFGYEMNDEDAVLLLVSPDDSLE